MNPADRLVHLRQGNRPIEDYVEDFCELCFKVDFNKTFLKDIFRFGLAKDMPHLMPHNTPQWSLERYIDFALRLAGSPFTVGVADEEPCYSPVSAKPGNFSVMSGIIQVTSELSHAMPAKSKPTHVMTTKPQSAHVMPTKPKPAEVMSTKPQPSHVMPAKPKPAQVISTKPEPSHVTSAKPQPGLVTSAKPQPGLATPAAPGPAHAMAALPESAPVMAALPQSVHKMAAIPKTVHKMAAIPKTVHKMAAPFESRAKMAATPEPHHTRVISSESHLAMSAILKANQVMADPPVSSQVKPALSVPSQITAVVPESSQVTAVVPESSQVTAVVPESSQVTAVVLESSHVTAVVPESSQVTAGLSMLSQATADLHEPSQVTADPHEPSQVTAVVPESGQATADLHEPSQVTADLHEPSQVTAVVPESSQATANLPEPSQVTAGLHEPSQVTAGLHEPPAARPSSSRRRERPPAASTSAPPPPPSKETTPQQGRQAGHRRAAQPAPQALATKNTRKDGRDCSSGDLDICAPTPGGGPGGCTIAGASDLRVSGLSTRVQVLNDTLLSQTRTWSMHSPPPCCIKQFDSSSGRFASYAELPSSPRLPHRSTQVGGIVNASQPVTSRGAHPGTGACLCAACEIVVLLAKDANEPVPPAEMKSGFYSPYFIVPKKSGGLQPILDLRVLNRSLHTMPFKMLTSKAHPLMHSSPGLVYSHRPKGCVLSCLDFYLDTDCFVRFAFKGRAYQYKVLPFGWALSPRVFTKLAEGALALLWEQGIRILDYLNDWLITAHSRDLFCEHRDLVLRHLSHLGLRVNWEKSKLSPVQSICFLGMELDSVNMRARLTGKQHSDSRLHQSPRWIAFPSHVATYPPSPPLESDVAQITDSPSRRIETPSSGGPDYLDRPVRFSGILPMLAVLLPDRGSPRHRCTGTQLAPGFFAQTLCKIREDGEKVLLLAPYWPTRTCPSLEDSTEEGPSFSGDGHNLAPAPRSAMIDTITQARAPSTRQVYALKWGLFVEWCSSRREDRQISSVRVVLSFNQEKLELSGRWRTVPL
ncbi:hypothetical protein M9458_051735 [Cirrhinus mrigala]|uniref:ribonuclease H n=1 Tax=Cirrhinus mrigala TaxID=683832 RepID=A0ABD0MSF0_CIRMR